MWRSGVGIVGWVLAFSALAWNDWAHSLEVVEIVRTLHEDLHLSFFSFVKTAGGASTQIHGITTLYLNGWDSRCCQDLPASFLSLTILLHAGPTAHVRNCAWGLFLATGVNSVLAHNRPEVPGNSCHLGVSLQSMADRNSWMDTSVPLPLRWCDTEMCVLHHFLEFSVGLSSYYPQW